MSTFLVADVGNSRIKWGLCDTREVLEAVSLPLDNEPAWDQQSAKWRLPPTLPWTVAGVNPRAPERFASWLRGRGTAVKRIHSHQQLPIVVAVDQPVQVGIDRLLNAVAFNARENKKRQGLIADAGSAVTVDWIDEDGVFRGGAIFPGLRLMAQALHQYTAKLPLVSLHKPPARMPGMDTMSAIATGIHGAVCGGIRGLTQQLELASNKDWAAYLTGGDSTLLVADLSFPWIHWPLMTLEGLRLAALRLP